MGSCRSHTRDTFISSLIKFSFETNHTSLQNFRSEKAEPLLYTHKRVYFSSQHHTYITHTQYKFHRSFSNRIQKRKH